MGILLCVESEIGLSLSIESPAHISLGLGRQSGIPQKIIQFQSYKNITQSQKSINNNSRTASLESSHVILFPQIKAFFFGGMDWKIFPWQQVQVQALLRTLPPPPAAGQSPAGALATGPRPPPSTALCDLNRTQANSARLTLITNICRYSALLQIRALTTPWFAPESIE